MFVEKCWNFLEEITNYLNKKMITIFTISILIEWIIQL